jgi:hypothetical protein
MSALFTASLNEALNELVMDHMFDFQQVASDIQDLARLVLSLHFK